MPGAAAAASGAVLSTELRGPVTPVTAQVLTDAVTRAEEEGAVVLLVEIDTPGGLDSSMRDIVQAFLNSQVPIVAYVSPSGSRAASAGALIGMSAHVLAMAPGTTIGAATPVTVEGAEVSDKVVNDAASYAVAVARQRDRSLDFAEAAVREGRSVTAEEAVEERVADLLAATRDGLLDAIDGRTVALASGGEVAVRTADAAVEEIEPSWLQSLLAWVVDPNLAFIFISLGTLAILYEFANPGIGAGAITGVILLVLAFYALAVLPTNIAGLALLLLAMALLIGELFVPGIGVLAAGGTIALLLAGIFLFPRATGLGVDLAVLLPVVVVAGAGTVAVAVIARRSWQAPASSGDARIVGHLAEVRTSDGRAGQVFVDGALWRARSGHPLVEGTMVRVVDRSGLTLTVEPVEEEDLTWS